MRNIVLITIFLICIGNSFGQYKSNNLLDKKVTLHVSNTTFLFVLSTLAQEYKIPIGWEKSFQHKDEFKISLNAKERSLQEVFDIIIAQEPEYKWELTNDVVNITPTRNRNEFLSEFLNLRINQITYPKDNDEDNFRKTILTLPEVASLMKSRKVEYAEYRNEPSDQPMFSKEVNNSVTLSATVRDFFNKVIKESDHNTWVVSMVGKDKNKLLISF